jgi:mycothiol synthase
MCNNIKEEKMTITLSKFTVRPAEADDLHAAVALFNTCSMAQVGKAMIEETEFGTEWKMPNFDLETDTRVVLDSGKMVGYAAVRDSAPHVRIFVQVRVHPEYVGQSIGTYLGQWAEARALQAVSKAPEGVRVALQQAVPQADVRAGALLSRLGYRGTRHFFEMVIEMDAPPPVPNVPDGIVIRPFVRETEDRVLVHAIRDAFKDHWGHVESPFEEDYAEWVSWMDDDPSFDQSLWFVAVEDSEIVGCSICYDVTGEGPDVGAVETLGVRRPWRRRGIALALLLHSFGELYRRGRTTVTLGVDAQSLTGALHLYEKAGMRVRYQYDWYEKELRPGVDLSTQELEV